jgi:hypothetical protein
LAGFPVARVPLWQFAHVPVAAPWSKFTFVQFDVLWQLSQDEAVGRCDADRPVAVLPL